jgi:hypothetical protein
VFEMAVSFGLDTAGWRHQQALVRNTWDQAKSERAPGTSRRPGRELHRETQQLALVGMVHASELLHNTLTPCIIRDSRSRDQVTEHIRGRTWCKTGGRISWAGSRNYWRGAFRPIITPHYPLFRPLFLPPHTAERQVRESLGRVSRIRRFTPGITIGIGPLSLASFSPVW